MGLSCTPTDEDVDGFADECSESSTPLTISGIDYFSVEVECYCPEETCGYDWNGDVVSHCFAPSGAACEQQLDSNNNYVDCASDPTSLAGTFTHNFVDDVGDPQCENIRGRRDFSCT